MAEQPISLDDADGVRPGAPNANADSRDPAGEDVAIIGPRTTLASARDRETVLYRVKHEQRRSKPLRSNNPLWKFFMVYLKDSLTGIAVCKLCEANGDFADAEVRFGSPTLLRQHLDTKRKGHREALKEHEARGAGSKGGGSGGASSEKHAGSIIAYMDGVKPFTSKMVRFIIDSYQAFSELEVLLYDDVPPDTKDSNGNSLLLLASQQGNKRMVKFLLRKGATMNHQNMDGNSVLHFCYSTGREASQKGRI